MDSDIEVRRIRSDEWREMREVRLRALADAPEAFATTHAEASARSDDEWERFTAASADSASQSSFVAVLDGRFVGLVSSFEPADDAGSVHLIQMWTASEARRRGVGRRLVDVILEFAGSSPVRLAVIRGNDGARLLYEAMGFVPDDRPPLPGDPCIDELHYVRTPTRSGGAGVPKTGSSAPPEGL